MANSYTAIPNLVPGNLTVTGKLTVSGGQIAMGKFQQQYRIQEISNGVFVETVNLDRIVYLQDDPTSVSLKRTIQPASQPFSVMTQSPAAPAVDNILLQQSPGEFQVLSPSFRVGAAFPYVRLYSTPPNVGSFSVNLMSDAVSRDDAANRGYAIVMNDSAGQLTTRLVDTAGNVVPADLRRVFWLDRSVHTMTGTTTQQTVASKVIFANQIGPDGGIYLLIMGNLAVAAGGQVILGFNWGGTQVPIVTFPSSTSLAFVAEVYIENTASTINQQSFARATYGTIAGATTTVSTTADTTVNQNLLITSTATLPADIIVVRGIEGVFISRASGI